MNDSGSQTVAPAVTHQLFILLLVEHLARKFSLPDELKQRITVELPQRVAPPKRSEMMEPVPAERLQKENETLLAAFRQALSSVPKSILPDGGSILDDATLFSFGQSEELAQRLTALESRLGIIHLGHLYAGTLHFFDQRQQRGQVLPVNWDGLRFRLLAAGRGDCTPRSHLNYFCSMGARVIEVMSERSYPPAEVRHLTWEAILEGIVHLQSERHSLFMTTLQTALHELTSALAVVQQVTSEIIRNVNASMVEQQALDTSLGESHARQSKLANTLKDVESSGIALPVEVRRRLKMVLTDARSLPVPGTIRMDDPQAMRLFLQQIDKIKKQTRSVTVELRRVRRQSLALLKKSAVRVGRAMEQLQLAPIRDQSRQLLIDSARQLIWSYQDLEYAGEMQETVHQQPDLLKIKAALLNKRGAAAAITALEGTLKEPRFDLARFRHAGKLMLQAAYQVLQHLPSREIDRNEETNPLWGGLADLDEAYEQFSTVIEGEDRQRLEELPPLLTELHQTLSLLHPGKAWPVGVGSAIERERLSQTGELRLSVGQRLDNLDGPLKELVKISLELSGGSVALQAVKLRALHALAATQEKSDEYSRNYLAELTVAPLVQFFCPQDPRRGRSLSDLERRLRYMPITALLPQAVLYGVRKANSLDDLGNPQESASRRESAFRLANRSGLVGQVLGIHPLWDIILASDETLLLAAEMRPLFAGDAGKGFLVRLTSENEEYHEFSRLDNEEKIAETSLLLEALTAVDGFSELQEGVMNAIEFLLQADFVRTIRPIRRRFLLNQREVLRQLGLDDVEGLLAPLTPPVLATKAEGLRQFFSPLPRREQALALLHLFHRRLLAPELFPAVLRLLVDSPEELRSHFPEISQELVENYRWLGMSAGKNGPETLRTRRLLREVEFDQEMSAVDEGLPLLYEIRQECHYLQGLRLSQPRNPVGKAIAWMRGDGRHLRRMYLGLKHSLRDLEELGFWREAKQLERELAQPAVPVGPATE